MRFQFFGVLSKEKYDFFCLIIETMGFLFAIDFLSYFFIFVDQDTLFWKKHQARNGAANGTRALDEPVRPRARGDVEDADLCHKGSQ
jgi:hypothetical protein